MESNKAPVRLVQAVVATDSVAMRAAPGNQRDAADHDQHTVYLSLGQHFGVHGLARSGFCDLRKQGPDDVVFPLLKRWLQD